MAHRLLAQVVVTGAKVFGRAFTEAYKQASAASATQGSQQAQKATEKSRDGDITLDESCKILDVDLSGLSLEKAQGKYDYLFDINSKDKGGSFYVQSKVFRAMERIKNEIDYLEKAQNESSSDKSQTTKESSNEK
ncbi:import motor complex subunit [Martiniozyma asiatica (nom. inval.)]|nr:import motor complex subunit [Martiniozyma asiatica]